MDSPPRSSLGAEGEEDDDNVSEISNLSGLSEETWRPTAGPMMWVQRQMMSGVEPRSILARLLSDDSAVPAELPDVMLWRLIVSLIAEPPPRSKLRSVNTLQDTLHLLTTCTNIVVLTGAGVSVSCGIPDFRSKDGIYARLALEYPDLPDPQAMFDIKYFMTNPGPFYKFAREIYPGQFEPSRSHKFIRLLECHGRLLRNYTQNIDTLEQVAGIERIIQCHGSFATASCMICKKQVCSNDVKADIMAGSVPRCPVCPPDNAGAIMKADIVFFGESLPDHFHKRMTLDKDTCDLLIVMGSSLKVRPVALIPSSLPANVPQILINREPLKHMRFDVEMLGDCDVIVNELARQLGDGWEGICDESPPLTQVLKEELKTPPPSLSHSAVHLPGNTLGEPMNEDTRTQDLLLDVADEIFPELNENAANTELNNFGDFSPGACSSNALPSECPDLANACVENNPPVANEAPGMTAPDESCPITSEEPTAIDDSTEFNGEEGAGCAESQHCSDWSDILSNVADRLPEDSFLFVPPSRYVFSGAELCEDLDKSRSSSSSDISDALDLDQS